MDASPLLTLAEARTHALTTDWDNLQIAVPWFVGRRVLDAERLEGILAADGRAGAAGLTAAAVYGFWPANSVDDDIIVYKNDARNVVLARFPMLRQQDVRAGGEPNLSLADFVAPKDSMAPDYIGMFAVAVFPPADQPLSAGGAELSARLADVCADHLHAQAREDWGCTGIRVEWGTPPCPDTSFRRTVLTLLDAQAVGISLSPEEHLLPAASRVGLYFSHPAAAPFSVGPVGDDQREDYAQRKVAALALV